MNIQQTYDYLVRARRELWTGLSRVPDEVLSRPLLDGSRFHCIKDLVNHIPSVEDGWIQEDILCVQPLRDNIPALKDLGHDPVYNSVPLEVQLEYWRIVEAATLKYLATLSGTDLERVVVLHDSPGERYTLDGLLWHVAIHEMRHTAQIALLMRLQGIKPPALDLLFYLPSA